MVDIEANTNNIGDRTPLLQHSNNKRKASGELGGDGGGDSARTVPLACLAGIVYFSVGGGPFGFEASIDSSSAAICFWALVVAAVLWALPQALCIAELSTVFKYGYNEWCTETLGIVCGFAHSVIRVVFSALTNAIYADLFASYAMSLVLPFIQSEDEPSRKIEFGVRVASLVAFEVLVACVNFVGVRTVGAATIVLTVLVLSPFAVMFGLAAPQLTFKPLVSFSSSDLLTADIPLLVCSIMFNLAGWDFVGNVSCLAKKPSRDVPTAIITALVLVCATYIAPLIASVSVLGVDGVGDTLFVDAARALWPPLAYAITAAAFVGIFGLATSFMSTSSEALAHSIHWGYLPKFIGRRFSSRQIPVILIILQSVFAVLICIPWDFSHVVQLQMWLFALSTLVILFGFVVRRWTMYKMARKVENPRSMATGLSTPNSTGQSGSANNEQMQEEQITSTNNITIASINSIAVPINSITTPPIENDNGKGNNQKPQQNGFHVPVGRIGATLLCLPPMCLCLFAVVWTSVPVMVIGWGVVVVAVCTSLVHAWMLKRMQRKCNVLVVPLYLTIEVVGQ